METDECIILAPNKDVELVQAPVTSERERL